MSVTTERLNAFLKDRPSSFHFNSGSLYVLNPLYTKQMSSSETASVFYKNIHNIT